jgi:IS1 family transposase
VKEKNTPLSEWKSDYTGKDENGVRALKEYLALPKLYALGDVYEKYQKALYDQGVFDYEDMILQVVEALSKSETLRAELEEQYHYIMVDEFQDTNNAQLSLVKALSSNEVHEGRANVCVVGDDDQAIYKFQGAEISNIHSFKELYKDVEVVVLTENYRSTQEILDFARVVVTQGVNRLENHYKEIRKDLVAKNKTLAKGDIFTYSFRTEEEEFVYVSKEIHKLLEEGVEAPSQFFLENKWASDQAQALNMQSKLMWVVAGVSAFFYFLVFVFRMEKIHLFFERGAQSLEYYHLKPFFFMTPRQGRIPFSLIKKIQVSGPQREPHSEFGYVTIVATEEVPAPYKLLSFKILSQEQLQFYPLNMARIVGIDPEGDWVDPDSVVAGDILKSP